MKAIIHKKYGPPNVASLAEVSKPQPNDEELLLKVYASTVNRTDSGFRSAEYFVSRFFSGLLKPKNQILGCEFSGVVESIGKNVLGFKIGDKVFGYNDKTFGGHAEYATISYKAAVAVAPKNISLHDAAAITEGAHYALNIIRVAKVKPGQNVLVYGATGAIGSSAVQLLNYFGANINAVCDTKNVELVKTLGATKVIDYQQSDFTKFKDTYDFVFDAVGKTSFGACKPLLNKNGIYISTELGKNGQNIFLALKHWALKSRKKVLFPIPPDLSKEDIGFLKDLVENGMFKPVIDSYRNLDDIVEIYTYVDSGQKVGNVVLEILN
ncbi:NAD(P)-dependent alcohol dehydrogenase [Pedobacter arcticus]|uniref:NAD(P)-dependent alcohol dehydrogenase n=1 Tax=Pedobacter arcticus TaxID=752140 RepID=UPI0002E13656|nr:NAD(P)-dependent alcohol dehydrogenase [Pedobacter arcticus]